MGGKICVSLSPCCYPQRPGWALPSSRPWFVWLSNERNSESRSLVIIRSWGRTGLVPWPSYRVRSLGMRFWNLSFRLINSCVHSCFFLWVQMYETERLTVCLRSCLTQAILRISPIDTSPLQHIGIYFGLWFSLQRLPQVRGYDVQRCLCYSEKETVFQICGHSQRLVCTFPHGTATKHGTLDSDLLSRELFQVRGQLCVT